MDNFYFEFRKKAEPLAKAASIITYPVLKGFDGAIKPKHPSRVRLFGVLVSDVHMRDEPYRNRRLYDGLYDLENSKFPIDVLTSAGDLTDHGELSEWATIVNKTKGHMPAKEIVLAFGNHDTWTTTLEGKDDYDYASGLFLHYIEKLTGVPEDKVRFTRVVKGYSFICMGSESCECDGKIGAEQIAWLDEELKKATENGRPAFVINHQALQRTHGLPYTFSAGKNKDLPPEEGGIREGNDEVRAVLGKYKNVLLISGHSHMGLCGKFTRHSTFEKVDSFYSINLPCYMFWNHDGLPSCGYGYVMEVYDDRVLLRARNFIRRVWIPAYDFIFPIN
ncbi:MAG: metallophosphoesterase [Clostridiales bacterium]|nr:metallophosphoesterase [Clostridiales bacterium]